MVTLLSLVRELKRKDYETLTDFEHEVAMYLARKGLIRIIHASGKPEIRCWSDEYGEDKE